MLEFLKKYFPQLFAILVSMLIMLNLLPHDYDPYAGDTTTSVTYTESTTEATPETTFPETTTEVEPTTDPDDPANWSTAQIVEYYKTAAAKTEAKGCKSHQTMQLTSLSGAPAFLNSTIEKAIDKNSKDFDGLTGGYENLQESDLLLASARRNNGKVIISMFPKDQTDGVNGKEGEGTVGHLVYVIDGVDQVLKEAGVSGTFPEGSAQITYKYAYANNVVIDQETGIIESGEWGYDAYVYLNGCKVAGITLKNINAVIKYTVVLL